MKKLLIMLMVVAMASFLFVGCIPVTPPVDPDEPVLPPSVTPVIGKIANVGDAEGAEGIINLYSSDTQYMNADEVDDGILVMGDAPRYSEVNVYVEGIVVGTSTAYGVSETFTVFVAEDDLGADGSKTLYATATEVGLAESVPSTVYEFTLDTVAPEVVEVTAVIGNEVVIIDEMDVIEATITITCSEALDEGTIDETSINLWDIRDITNDFGNHIVNISVGSELTSPEVIEIVADLDITEGTGMSPPSEEGDLIRVEYEIRTDDNDYPGADDIWVYIKDLAGNLLSESVHYCYLESAD